MVKTNSEQCQDIAGTSDRRAAIAHEQPYHTPTSSAQKYPGGLRSSLGLRPIGASRFNGDMNADLLLTHDWSRIVSRLGGAAALASTARICKAFLRPRGIRDAVDLLRIILAYCLGDRGLRATAAWAAASGLADISNPAILYRLRHCGDWLTVLIGQLLGASTPTPAHGRLIRLIDASTVAKPGPEAKKTNKLWRVHAAFDLPAERFGYFELTDEHSGERVDRIPVVAGEIRIGDRIYLQPDRIAAVLDAGGDVLVRAGWRNARWLDQQGERSICSPSCLVRASGSTGQSGSAARAVLLEPLVDALEDSPRWACAA